MVYEQWRKTPTRQLKSELPT